MDSNEVLQLLRSNKFQPIIINGQTYAMGKPEEYYNIPGQAILVNFDREQRSALMYHVGYTVPLSDLPSLDVDFSGPGHWEAGVFSPIVYTGQPEPVYA